MRTIGLALQQYDQTIPVAIVVDGILYSSCGKRGDHQHRRQVFTNEPLIGTLCFSAAVCSAHLQPKLALHHVRMTRSVLIEVARFELTLCLTAIAQLHACATQHRYAGSSFRVWLLSRVDTDSRV